MLSRRAFLKTSSLVSLSPVLPSILGNTARAAAAAPDETILVVVQLDGGNDGINTVVPLADDAYGRVRDKLRLESGKLHKLDDYVGLHPNMKAAKELYDDGQLTVVQAVGYPNPDRSHFRSMKIWQTARFDAADHDGYGWLGRTLDQQPTAGQGGTANAIYVGEQETPVALWGRRSSATALSSLEDLHLRQDVAIHDTAADTMESPDSVQQFVTKQVLSAYAAADEFKRQDARASNAKGRNYPNSQLASQLELVAQLVKSGADTRIYYTTQSGYDTHAAQLYTHARLLRGFSDALKAFLDDLQSAKLDDRVVVLAFSEFGRRVQENDSQGTDHGTAGPVFLAGSSLRGGLIGAAPDLTDLDNGDIKMQTDFRAVYASLLDKWLGVDSQSVLGAEFAPLQLFPG